MTAKDVLEQYKFLNAELRQINNRLQVLSAEPTHYATDSVLASPAHEPYQNRPIPIRGNVQEKGVSTEFQSLTKYYKHLRKKLYAECLHAESIIAHVDNARARTIIRYRYIDGMDWPKIAAKMGYPETEDTVRKCASNYLKKIL